MKDSQILANLLDVCAKESVEYTEDGMEAIIFTAQVKKSSLVIMILANNSFFLSKTVFVIVLTGIVFFYLIISCLK